MQIFRITYALAREIFVKENFRHLMNLAGVYLNILLMLLQGGECCWNEEIRHNLPPIFCEPEQIRQTTNVLLTISLKKFQL